MSNKKSSVPVKSGKDQLMISKPTDYQVREIGPWQGPTTEEWLKRMSWWPTPWIDRVPSE